MEGPAQEQGLLLLFRVRITYVEFGCQSPMRMPSFHRNPDGLSAELQREAYLPLHSHCALRHSSPSARIGKFRDIRDGAPAFTAGLGLANCVFHTQHLVWRDGWR